MLCADPGLLLISRVAIFITSMFKTIDCTVAVSTVMPMLSPNPGSCESLSLPPGFRLHPVCETAGSVLERDSTHQTAEPVGPVRVGQENAQYRPAEELSACSNLRRDREFAQPPVELRIAVCGCYKAFGVVKPTLERQREILGEEN